MSKELNLLPQFNNPQFADAVLWVCEVAADTAAESSDEEESTSLENDKDGAAKHDGPGENVNPEETDEIPCKRRCPSPCPSDNGSDITIRYIDENVTTLPCAFQNEGASNHQPVSTIEVVSDDQVADEKNPVTQAKRYHVHRFLLASHSKYFESLFLESEKAGTKAKEIRTEIEEGASVPFERLLRAVYSKAALDNLTYQEIVDTISIADRFRCEIILNQCLVMLSERDINTVDELNSAIHCLYLVAKRKVPEDTVNLRKYLSDKMNKLFGPNLDLNISENGMAKINSLALNALVFLSRRVKICSENSLLTCILSWAEVNKPPPHDLERILRFIQKEFLSCDFLNDVITPHHPILSEIPSFRQWFIGALQYHSFSEARKANANRNKRLRQRFLEDQSYMLRMVLTPTPHESSGASQEELPKIYKMTGPLLLWDGYFIDIQIFLRNNNVSIKLEVPNLVGIDGEFYLPLNIVLHLKEINRPEWNVKVLRNSFVFKCFADFDKELQMGYIWHFQLPKEELKARLTIEV